MFDVVVASHGFMSQAIIASAELIAGKQERVHVLCLEADCDLHTFGKGVNTLFDELSASGPFLVLTDLMYGTPFNTIACLSEQYTFHHFTGVNLPILLEVLTSRTHRSIDEVCQFIKVEGPKTIVSVNDLLKEDSCK